MDNQLFSLIDQVNKQRYNATQFDITINDFNKRNFIVDVEALVYMILIILFYAFHKWAIMRQIDRSIVYKNIHSVSGLSSLMAHEIPMSGIKGAAQLLNDVVPGEDKDLTSLIIDEVDRIGELVNRVNSISDNSIVKRHQLISMMFFKELIKLQRIVLLQICINELYDPKLIDIYGDINSLIQVFLNLFLNAAEAKPDGDITIQTGYRHGFNIKVS